MENAIMSDLFQVEFIKSLPWECYNSLSNQEKLDLIEKECYKQGIPYNTYDPDYAEKYFHSSYLTEYVKSIDRHDNILEINFELSQGILVYLINTCKEIKVINISLFEETGMIHDKIIVHATYLSYSLSLGYNPTSYSPLCKVKFLITSEEILGNTTFYDSAIESL